MRSNTAILVGAAAVYGACSISAHAQQDFSSVEITIEEVRDGVYFLVGAGGNMGLSVGEDGAFLIDDQFAPLTEKIRAAIASVTDDDVEFLLNTHFHYDHAGGNENFGEAGAHIVAHDNARKRLETSWYGDSDEPGPAPAAALPVITFSKDITFHWNGQEINVFHVKNAHTDGDAIVYFKTANIMHAGDVIIYGGFPLIHVDGGGSVKGYVATLEKILATIDDDTIVIPGHGPLSRKSDVARLLSLLQDVQGRIETLVADGLSEDEAVAASPLADLDAEWGQGFVKTDYMVRSVYQSLTASAN